MKRLFPSLLLLCLCVAAHAADKSAIPISPLNRTTAVDFDSEILPFLRDNCLACHCKTTAKSGLNIETPQDMIKGGDSGAAIKPQHGAESLALQAAAHQDEDTKMPPRDNKAKARDLTPEQLALFRLWIDQGAKLSPKTERLLAWQAIPDAV